MKRYEVSWKNTWEQSINWFKLRDDDNDADADDDDSADNADDYSDYDDGDNNE